MNKKIFKILICIFLVFSTVLGCGRACQQKDKVIATINGDPIYVRDLNREIALSFKRDPMFKVTPQTLENQLNILIDRRLLIQEAKKKKLDQTNRFVNTIKTFWEQTLIRDLMIYKNKELDKAASLEKKDKRELLDKWFSKIRNNADIKINRDVLKSSQYRRD